MCVCVCVYLGWFESVLHANPPPALLPSLPSNYLTLSLLSFPLFPSESAFNEEGHQNLSYLIA